MAISTLIARLRELLAKLSPRSKSPGEFPKTPKEDYVDHTVILRPEEAARFFESIATQKPKTQNPIDEDTLADFIPNLKSEKKSTSLVPFTEDTDKDIVAPPKKRERKKGTRLPSLSFSLPPITWWILPFLLLLLPIENTLESFQNRFFFRFFYLAGTLSLFILGLVMGFLSFKDFREDPHRPAKEVFADIAPFLALTLSASLLYIILSLLFYSPFDETALTLLHSPLDSHLHSILLFYLIGIGVALALFKPIPTRVRPILLLPLLYPIIAWGWALARRSFPEELFLGLSPFSIFPSLFAGPLHVTTLFIIPLLFLLALAFFIKSLIKKEDLGNAAIPLLFIAPLYILLGFAIIRSYGLPLPLLGPLSLPGNTTHTFDGAASALTLSLKGSSENTPPPFIISHPTIVDDLHVSIPIAVRSTSHHALPFLDPKSFGLSFSGQPIKTATVQSAQRHNRPRSFTILIALSEAEKPFLKQIKLAMMNLLDFKYPRDEIGFFLLGTGQTQVDFLKSREKILEVMAELGSRKPGLQKSLEGELPEILKSLYIEVLKRRESDSEVVLFASQKLLDGKPIQDALLPLKQKSALTVFSTETKEDLLLETKHWLAELYADYLVKATLSHPIYTVKWSSPENGISPRQSDKVRFDLGRPLEKTIQKVEFVIDDTTVKTYTPNQKSTDAQTLFYFPKKDLSEGDHRFQVRLSSDKEKLFTSEHTVHVASQEKIEFSYPEEGDAVSGEIPIQVSLGTAKASDISVIRLFANGEPLTELKSEPFVYYWKVGEAGVSLITLSLKAELKSGSPVEDKVSVQSGSAFQLAFTHPTFGEYVGRDLNIELNLVKPARDGIAHIDFFLDDAPISPTPSPDNPLAFSFKVPGDLSGKHRLKAKLTSQAGVKSSAVVLIQIGTAKIHIKGESESAPPLFIAPHIYWMIDASSRWASDEGFKTFEAVKSAIFTALDRFPQKPTWSLGTMGGLRLPSPESCGDIALSPSLSEEELTRHLLTLSPKGRTPLLAGLRRLFAKPPFKEAGRLILIAGGGDNCETRIGHLFQSEALKAKILPKLSTRIVVPYRADQKTADFLRGLSNSLQGEVLFLEKGTIDELIESSLAYTLSISDKDGELVWSGPFKPGTLELPMGAYTYSLGEGPSAAKGEITLKNKGEVTWIVKQAPAQNPPYSIEDMGGPK